MSWTRSPIKLIYFVPSHLLVCRKISSSFYGRCRVSNMSDLITLIGFSWSCKCKLKLGSAGNVLLLTCITGECCVALRSLIGASEQFETFLCHRGEEMGSVRGRVRLHVPKDRRTVREKVYGGSNVQNQYTLLLLRLDYHFPLSLRKLSGPASRCFLSLVPQWSLA